MNGSQRTKGMLDVVSTCLVGLAAGIVLWTQVESRWFRTTRPQIEDLQNVTIDAHKARHTKGSAAVALVEFTDYDCPFCSRHSQQNGLSIDERLVQTGQLRHIVFNFPLETIHPHARKAAEAAECAGRQGRHWQMHQRLFAEPAQRSNEGLLGLAISLGVDRMTFERCLQGEAASAVSADIAEGKRLGVTGTPTFFVGVVQPDGLIRLTRRLSGTLPFEQFVELVREANPIRTVRR